MATGNTGDADEQMFWEEPLLQLQALPRSPPHLVNLLQHAPLACASLSVTHLSGAVVVPHLQATCTQSMHWFTSC